VNVGLADVNVGLAGAWPWYH